ncbi:TetR/AcrR family transcriptional regulator [Aquabacterium sp.]|uniref:TetR/AcrR family transcriptional regulator n=1 Tax=Aquabacterium sp. TaxID=1872578 RepID=UPI002486D9C2|nr:TetR/AcrR family transcriptional regulator [Aquabacterium sp.]MDI1260217.1 TetR/AcrR family transcriptional regulator [Aquabacterium sp.]
MTDHTLSPVKRGRPRDPERMRRVLHAATRQFLDRGLERTSMESVARDAGVSKMTIYSYFPSKEALFEAAVSQHTDQVIGFIGVADMDPHCPAAVLTALGRRFLEFMGDPNVIDVQRILFSQGGQHQEIREAFFRQGPDRLARELTQYLHSASRVGSLQVGQPKAAADQFLSLFLGRRHYCAMLGLPLPSDQDDTVLLEANVTLFMRGYAAMSPR